MRPIGTEQPVILSFHKSYILTYRANRLSVSLCLLLTRGHVQYTDKKENQIFLIYKEIQNGAVAKSYTVCLTASSYMGIYLLISSYIRKRFLIYDFANAPLWISEENSIFFFISVRMCGYVGPCRRSSRKMKESKEGNALFAVFETGSSTSHRKLVRTKPLSYT